jgi:apolipoprotein N-acyltransferase
VRRPAVLRSTRAWVLGWALVVAPLLYGASFPLWRIAWVAWVALIPWCVALRTVGTLPALLIACGSTLLGSYACTTWLPSAVANYYQQPLALGIVLFVGVYVVSVGPYIVAFTLGYRRLAERPSAWLPLLAGAAWAAAEAGRVRLLIGNPFGLFGYSQVGVTPLVQIADVTGIYGVSCILIAANAAAAELWLAYGARRLSYRGPVCTPAQAWRGAALVGVALAGMLVYGGLRLRSYDAEPAPASTRVAIVQGNLDLGSQWRQEFYGRNLEQYMRLTLDRMRADRPPLVFWPESAMTFFLADEPLYRAAIGRLLLPTQTQLVAGGVRAEGASSQRYYNAGFLVAPDGSIVATYDKQQLLPFAEYFPFGGIDLLRREFGRVREFTPGGPARLLPTVAGAAGVVICNEAMFGEIATERVRAGADYLVTLANDSWLGDRKFAEQAFDMARLRAVEQRRYLVRASTSGPSAIVDPCGRVVSRTRDDVPETLGGTIRAMTGLTPYARYGDVFGLLCVLVPVTVLVARRRRAPQRNPQAVAARPEAGQASGDVTWRCAETGKPRGNGAISNP